MPVVLATNRKAYRTRCQPSPTAVSGTPMPTDSGGRLDLSIRSLQSGPSELLRQHGSEAAILTRATVPILIVPHLRLCSPSLISSEASTTVGASVGFSQGSWVCPPTNSCCETL